MWLLNEMLGSSMSGKNFDLDAVHQPKPISAMDLFISWLTKTRESLIKTSPRRCYCASAVVVKQTGAKLARLDASIVSEPQITQARDRPLTWNDSECKAWNLEQCYDESMSFPLSNQFPDILRSGTKSADIQD